jgi:hypothetical protein
VKEIDDFLPRWVTPALSARGYRKSSHTYRKHFESGDWGLFSFTSFPASLPAVGLFTFWLRATEDASVPWFGYALLWGVMVALSLVPTVVTYAFARATASPLGSA